MKRIFHKTGSKRTKLSAPTKTKTCGLKRESKTTENGCGTLKTRKTTKVNILTCTPIYNLFQDTTDLTYGL